MTKEKKKIHMSTPGQVTLSNYDIQKQMYKQVPKATDIVLNTAYASIGAWFSARYEDKYFVLMNREKMDINIFHFQDSNYQYAKEQIKELLESRGEVVDIQFDHQNQGYDCWVKTDADDILLYKLFDAQFMVIEV